MWSWSKEINVRDWKAPALWYSTASLPSLKTSLGPSLFPYEELFTLECIWVLMCRKNSDPIHVIFSTYLPLQCALLCLPGSLELGCSWTEPQCKSPWVINLAKPNVSLFSGNYFFTTFNCNISSSVRAFDLIPKLRARPKYQLIIWQ